MIPDVDDFASTRFEPLIRLIGTDLWKQRMTEIRDLAASGPRAGVAIRQHHSL
jgi:hypothetical protein